MSANAIASRGAPTSPGICNALVLRLDRRLAGLAKKHNMAYTRYADDLSFSGDLSREAANKIRQVVMRIVTEEGFKVNIEKTRLMGGGARQTVTGVIVNKELGLSRQERRRFRAALHQLSLRPSDLASKVVGNQMRGKLAYLSMLNPGQAEKLSG